MPLLGDRPRLACRFRRSAKHWRPQTAPFYEPYANGQIVDVRDVSDENNGYFARQMEPATIENTIKGYKNVIDA